MEMAREKLYESIEIKGLADEETIKASEELDQQVLIEMLNDPVIKNIYLEQVIKAKDIQIEKLKETIKNIRGQRRVYELAEVAAMVNETGAPAVDGIKLAVYLSKVKGI